MKRRVARVFRVLCYYGSWAWFAGGSLLLNAACAPLLLLPGREAAGGPVRGAIRLLFRLWRSWFQVSGIVRLSWRGFDRPLEPGVVYIANHPTLLDATVILAGLPDAICLAKASLLRHPVVAPAALMAGYVGSDPPIEAVRQAAARVAAGRSLLIFPEGTRTPPGTVLGPINPLFALIAERAKAPVQLITVRVSPGLAPKGRPWWRLPALLPGWLSLTLDRRWDWDARRPSGELVAEVRDRMQAALASD